MSIATEITRLKNAKSAIKTSIESKGVTVGDGTLDTYASKIDEISVGGGGIFTGSYDAEGLKQIGWTDEDIAFYNKYGVQWDEEYNDVFKLNESELAGDTSTNTRFLPKDHTLTSFGNYSKLIALPKVDVSLLTPAAFWFNDCYNLTALNLDYSAETKPSSMDSPFSNCINLKTVFLSGVASGTDFWRVYIFYNYSSNYSSIEFISIDSDIKNLVFTNSTNLRKIEAPSITYEYITNYPFQGCSHLKFTPPITLPGSMLYTFDGCTSLISIPELTLKSLTSVSLACTFRGCKSLLAIPNSLSGAILYGDMPEVFKDCILITTVPTMNTARVRSMVSTFEGCSNLLTLPQLMASRVTNITDVLKGCSSLTDFGGFVNLGESYDEEEVGYSAYTLDLSTCSNLTHDSLVNIINNLYDIKTNGCAVQYLNLGTANKAKLTDAEIAVAENKGWFVLPATITVTNEGIRDLYIFSSEDETTPLSILNSEKPKTFALTTNYLYAAYPQSMGATIYVNSSVNCTTEEVTSTSYNKMKITLTDTSATIVLADEVS